MTDTAVTVTKLTPGVATADVAGTAITAGNTHTITPPLHACLEEIVVRVKNTTAATKIATVTAGVNPPASLPAATGTAALLTDGSSTPTYAWIPLSSAQHSQKDGTAVITVASSMTGTIAAFWIPRTA